MEKTVFRKIISLFWEPSATFKSLKIKVAWSDLVIPMLIVIITTIIASSYIAPIAVRDYKVRIENNDRLTDAQKEAGLARIEKQQNSPLRYVTSVIALGIKWLVVAGAILFIVNFILGGELNYFTMLGITAYISLIDAVNLAVKTPLIISQQTSKIYSSPALFMDESNSFIYHFLSNIDIFALWKIVLFGIAIGVFLNKKSTKPILAIIIVWLIYVTVSALLAGMFNA